MALCTRVAVGLIVVLLAPLTVQAAQIYGTLLKGGGPLAGASVTVTCESGDDAAARTDDRGAYRLFVGHTGRCTLTVPEHGGASRRKSRAARTWWAPGARGSFRWHRP